MASYGASQRAFAGDGNVHGSVEFMVDWNRNQYNSIVKKLDKIAQPMQIRKAINRAAKEAADTGVTMTKRGIANDTTLKPADIGKRVKRYQFGSAMSMAIGMKISDTARPFVNFAYTPKKPKPKTAPTVEFYKGKKTIFEKGAFVQRMPTGHIGIYERTGEDSLPIKQMTGPSVTGIFKANESIHQFVWDAIWKKFEDRIMHNLEFILDGK